MKRKINQLPRKPILALASLTLVALSGCVADDALNDDRTRFASHASDNFPLQAMRRGAAKCGNWPEDMTQTSDNVRYANHGCAVQANIAAMIANPATINQPAATDLPMGGPAAAAVRNMNSQANASAGTLTSASSNSTP